jgi:hypothetical protein
MTKPGASLGEVLRNSGRSNDGHGRVYARFGTLAGAFAINGS